MLILFDIDGTLITTGGAGVRAMGDAGRELFGEGFTTEGTEFAGRLDPLIIADLLRANGHPAGPDEMTAMRDAYRRHLAGHLRDRQRCHALPGVHALLAELERLEAIVPGLLTGNYPDTGIMKLVACGIDPASFRVRVWGDESPHKPPSRNHLPAVGLERYCSLMGSVPAPERIAIVGDTPHDVACARAHGCRAVGVATGSYTADQLRRAGADHVLGSLADTDEALRAILTAR